jgi:hypothetical protein
MCGVLLLELGSNHINIRICLSLGHLRCVLQGGLGGNVVISCHPRISTVVNSDLGGRTEVTFLRGIWNALYAFRNPFSLYTERDGIERNFFFLRAA